ncbi:unnamed protein product [Caenorhabditis sp. 36 PRJEB53466]|nr:unnamed protein product [Caenorhabditis sp. 36 PRJEB53466]
MILLGAFAALIYFICVVALGFCMSAYFVILTVTKVTIFTPDYEKGVQVCQRREDDESVTIDETGNFSFAAPLKTIMLCFETSLLKYLYVLMLILWAVAFVCLFSGLLNEWFFPEPEEKEEFEEVIAPSGEPKFVALDVAQLDRVHGCAPYEPHIHVPDSLPLVQI